MELRDFRIIRKKVKSLASSRGTSNGPDWTDITIALMAMELEEFLDLTVLLRPVMTGTTHDLEITIEARPKLIWKPEAPPWESVKLRCLGSRARTLEGALLAAVYQLDFRIAARSHVGQEPKKA